MVCWKIVGKEYKNIEDSNIQCLSKYSHVENGLFFPNFFGLPILIYIWNLKAFNDICIFFNWIPLTLGTDFKNVKNGLKKIRYFVKILKIWKMDIIFVDNLCSWDWYHILYLILKKKLFYLILRINFSSKTQIWGEKAKKKKGFLSKHFLKKNYIMDSYKIILVKKWF